MKTFLSICLVSALLMGILAGCGPVLNPPNTDPTHGNIGTDPNHPSKPNDPSLPTGAIQTGNISINEVMPDNKKLVLGHELDWIELYNAEDVAVNLDGYYLADNPENPTELSLDGLQIPAKGYLLITLDDASPFRLSADGETVYLFVKGEVVAQLTYGLVENGESVDANGICSRPTPGHANNEEGYMAYLKGLTLPELIINEVISSNNKYLPVKGECYDMVEIRNNSDHPIDLSEYTLSDKRSEPTRYTFPAVTLQPGEYFIVYCSGLPALGNAHTSFKLSASGETVYLSKNGTLTDVLTIPADLQKNESFGRIGNIPMYFPVPSFGADNVGGHLTGVAVPQANLPSGLYGEAVTITLSGDGDIYYTTDGSRPTTKSTRYTDPIVVDGVTTIRTFLVSGERTSIITNYTYIIGTEHQLPVVSISIPQEYLSGDKGILNHPEQTYEYEAVLTLLENGKEEFSIPFGFRLHGNDSRKEPKQNFQLRFRSEYGASELNYKVFEELDINSFNSLLLKGGSEDWYGSIIRDEMATAIATGTTHLYTQAIKPVVLYLGGEYWGTYFIRERFSDDYVASHFDVSNESVDLLYSSGGYVQNGSAKDFSALKKFCQNNDMSKKENYEYLCSQIDVLSLIDWYVCRSYMGDKDIANIRRFRTSEGDGKWRWMFFDMDWCFVHTTDDPITSIMAKSGENILMKAVLKSKQGRETFLKRCAELLDETLNEEYIIGVIDSLAEAIDSEMTRDRERWGYSYKHWQNKVQKLRDYVADGARTKNFLRDLQDYFDLSDAEMDAYFG
jgi:hypothetical protein